jgi:hypothetical protein
MSSPYAIAAGLLLAVSDGVAATAAESGGYPTPEQAGFHHCALIYDRPVRGVRELTPYVVRTHPGGEVEPGEWLFDAYLFLIFTTPGGLRTDSGPTRMDDWQYCLDRWFGQDRDLAALDEAIDRAARVSGKPPNPRSVVLTIPYIHREAHEFGDVDGDGRTEDLATERGRQAAIVWYRDETARRFAAAKYRHLRLWGFYWMAEGVSEKDIPVVRTVARTLHDAGHRFLWIPWFVAPGWERWKEMGFDVAIMQPNYAFKSNTHKGRVRRNRLDINAGKAREAGLGVEMEAGAVLVTRSDWQPFLHYLVDGAPERLGYQKGAMAHYLEASIVEDACYSTNAGHRVLYDRIADFVSGKTIVDPQAAVVTGVRAAAGSLTLSGRFPAPRALGGMDVRIDEPSGTAPWTGTAEVRVKGGGDGAWTAGGWAVRTGADARDGRRQILSVPLDAVASEFEIVLRPFAGSRLPGASAVQPDPIDCDEILRHAALGARYTLSPMPEGAYGDTPARLLTDGVIPAKGWGKGRTVGWMGSKVCASAVLDLGREFAIERVEVHGVGGGSGSVNFPSRTVAMLGCGRPAPATASSVGALPADFVTGACGELTIGRRRSATDADGHVPATFAPGSRGRYVTISQQGPGSWIMLSEIRAFSGGTNVAVSAPYTLFPPPTPVTYDEAGSKDENLRYPDDGARLTDGLVAKGFSRGQTTGWRGAGARSITVDLGDSRPVRRVRIWALRGGRSGICAPGKVAVSLSANGSTWLAPVSAPAPAGPPEDGSSCEAAAFEAVLPAGATARHVRVDLAPGRGWTMVSEVEVQSD